METLEQAPEIDLLSVRSFQTGQPHEQFRWLREHHPVYRHSEPGGPGFWALTRYEEVRLVGRDAKTYSSEPTVMISDGSGLGGADHRMMLMADAPRHRDLRRIVSPDFLPKAAALLKPRIEELAAQIVGAVVTREECDLVADVAGLMPSYVIAEMLDIPHEDGVELYSLTEAIHAAPGTNTGLSADAAFRAMFEYAHRVWERKRDRPGDDLASRIVHASAQGRPLDELDFQLFFLLLIDAGGDTTRNLIAGGMATLFEHPVAADALRRDVDGLLPGAIEEMLRWLSPVVYMRRTATADTTLGGMDIAAGEKVVMYYGAANRDPARFPDPERFDITRDPNPHLAFGGGPHFCLGAHLGRAEIRAMMRQLLLRLPDMRQSGPAQWQQSVFVSGPQTLPVRIGRSAG